MSLTKADGTKRLIASFLAILVALASYFPFTTLLVVYLQGAAATVGTVGLVHAASAQTLGKAKLANASAIFSVLLQLAAWIPALTPYAPLITTLAGYFGVAAVTAKVVE